MAAAAAVSPRDTIGGWPPTRRMWYAAADTSRWDILCPDVTASQLSPLLLAYPSILRIAAVAIGGPVLGSAVVARAISLVCSTRSSELGGRWHTHWLPPAKPAALSFEASSCGWARRGCS